MKHLLGVMSCRGSTPTQHSPARVSSQDVGLNTEAVVYQDSSASSHSNSQTKSLGLPHHHRSTGESSHGRCLLSSRQNLRSTQVFSTSSNKHPGKRGQLCKSVSNNTHLCHNTNKQRDVRIKSISLVFPSA